PTACIYTGDAMYRISRVFETPTVAIVKLAGHIADSEADTWSDFLDELDLDRERRVILDFCEVSRIGRKAATILVDCAPPNVLLLNCPMVIKNMICSAGFASRLLETTELQTQALG